MSNPIVSVGTGSGGQQNATPDAATDDPNYDYREIALNAAAIAIAPSFSDSRWDSALLLRTARACEDYLRNG